MTNGFRPSSEAAVNAFMNKKHTMADSRSSPGLTRVGRTNELDRSASLNLAARAMKLKMKTSNKGSDTRQREVSERRQVGDAENVVNPPATQSSLSDGSKSDLPWWRNVTMEEGM